MLVDTFAVGPLEGNCTILGDTKSQAAIVIDPGGDFSLIRERVQRANVTVKAILLTHAHFDHIGAGAELRRLTGADIHLHPADVPLYHKQPAHAAAFGLPPPEDFPFVTDLADNGTIKVDGLELSVLHTPGHSPGGVCFLLRTGQRSILFAGDTLFRRGVGRTDLWGGDEQAIVRSIRTKLFTLDETTVVVPGHGPRTTIGEERRGNPVVHG